MNWYLTKVVFQIICGDGNHIAQFDEQLRLVNAEDLVSAFEKATTICKQESQTFFNDKQQLVHWKFINVLELYCLNEHTDGAEVCGRIKEVTDANLYLEFIQSKAAKLVNAPEVITA